MKSISAAGMGVAVWLSLGFWQGSAFAQIPISTLALGVYNQSFDSLANSGTALWTNNLTLPGWYAAKTSGTPSYFTNYSANTGSGTTGALYSYGAAATAERALGSLASGNANIGDIAYGVRFTNDTGTDVTSLRITYTGEQWRNSAAAAQTLAFSYRVSTTAITDPQPGTAVSWIGFPALDFATPVSGGTAGALDGNASANRVTFSDVLLSGGAVPAGSELFLRWQDLDDSGTDHGVAIDGLTVVFSTGSLTTNAPTYASVTPLSQTNKASATATFTATSDGSPSLSLSYSWRRNASPLEDAGGISGSATPTLTVSNLLAANAGSYDVVVANTSGSVTSSVATLTVIDPAIISQSADQAKLGGESVNLTVTAKGTPTLAYQWFFGGAPVDGATRSALSFSNLQATNQGTYTCWVTNGAGAGVTSAPINLTVTVFPSVTLALWDFNDTNAPATAPPPSLGTGSAALLGSATATFTSGVSSDHSATGTNAAWNTSGYPAQSTSSRTAGVQFNVSTLGYRNIYLAWNQRHSASASKHTRLQYTVDGTMFSDLDLNAMSTDSSFVSLTRDLSGSSAVNNNPNFGFRLVTEFESAANPTYVPTATGSSYSSSGTIRFDLVHVYGDPMDATTPAPTTISNILAGVLTYGGGGGAQFVLLRSTNAASPLTGWSRSDTNFSTPGTFTLPGGAETGFYRIKSE